MTAVACDGQIFRAVAARYGCCNHLGQHLASVTVAIGAIPAVRTRDHVAVDIEDLYLNAYVPNLRSCACFTEYDGCRAPSPMMLSGSAVGSSMR
jgi:hypothetical protein